MDFCLNLNSSERKLTFGGALTTRAETEILAKRFRFNNFYVRFSKDLDKPYRELLWNSVFKESEINFYSFKENKKISFLWPSTRALKEEGFEFHSFKRLSYLYSKYQISPRLSWKKDLIESALSNFSFSEKIIFVHLKNIYPHNEKESNVNWEVWKRFFNKSFLDFPEIVFCLIGDDKVEIDLNSFDNVILAKDENLSLAQQLALVSRSYGFIGLASGLCSAANFSNIPYVIIKHPSHHAYEMDREMGDNEAFNFSERTQLLWRKEQSIKILNSALKLIIKHHEIKK